MSLKQPKTLLTFILLVTMAVSCTRALPETSSNTNQITNSAPSDSIFIHIKALNLSEDMSKILSTNNDELLLLMYEYQDSGTLSKSVFQQLFVTQKNLMEHRFFWQRQSDPVPEKLLFLLIEQDFNRPIEQIDPVIRVEHRVILEAFKRRDYKLLKQFLGSEDLLGFKLIGHDEINPVTSFKIEGVHKLDWYEYEVTIGSKLTSKD